MSWKNTQQNSFADSLVIEHKSLSELDDVHNIINWGEIEPESIMREIFGNVIEKMPAKLIDLSAPEFLPCTILNKHTEDTKF
jgi:hypothetical protein